MRLVSRQGGIGFVNPMAWNIAAVLLPSFVLAFLSHQAGEKIRCYKFLPGRA